jgi:hypothetical protein
LGDVSVSAGVIGAAIARLVAPRLEMGMGYKITREPTYSLPSKAPDDLYERLEEMRERYHASIFCPSLIPEPDPYVWHDTSELDR